MCGFILLTGSPWVGRKTGSEQPRLTSSQVSPAGHGFLSQGPLRSATVARVLWPSTQFDQACDEGDSGTDRLCQPQGLGGNAARQGHGDAC